jgi:hypothetical protein
MKNYSNSIYQIEFLIDISVYPIKYRQIYKNELLGFFRISVFSR